VEPRSPGTVPRTLLLVRHGRAEGNAEGRFIGQDDVPLTPRGRAQAARLAERLRTAPITRIVSSDLQRCTATAAPLAGALGLEIGLDPRLREIGNGAWSGLLGEEIEARWPSLYRRYRSGEDVARPGGETWREVSRRVIAALRELAAATAGGETALIATHGGPIAAAARWAAGIPPVGNVFSAGFAPVANTSITTLWFPGPRLVGYGDARHLEPLGDGDR
jgi:probable phosphoglycerate mutase